MQTSASLDPSVAASGSSVRRRRDPRLWLAIYAVLLGVVAFWPVPVDSGAGGLLRAITAAVPWLTYDVIEVAANVVLFVPLGILLAMLLPTKRWLVAPIALAVTTLIECAQALFLDQRTPSVRDAVANLVGALIGLAIVVAIARRNSLRD